MRTGPKPEQIPDAESILVQLDRILASELFAESERLRRFLRFTVDLTLQGGGSQIKEYLLGLEVCGRDQSFDPRTDPIVRVQAGKLRSKLEKYYGAVGGDDPVIIKYPKGSYVPSFRLRAAAEPPQPQRPMLPDWWKAAALGTAGLLLAGFLIYRSAPSRHTGQPALAPASIAVLPFVDMSENKDQEFLSDGITEDIITALAKVDGLRVVARTSAFEFKGKGQDIRKIGAQLNVATVLEGSVQKAGGTLRITAQLNNVKDGYHLWAETYDRESKDLFAIQEEIAQKVVNALHVRLAPRQKGPLIKRYTDDPEVYRLYLRGRHYFHRPDIEGQRVAIQYFDQALARDPRHAPALAGMSDAYLKLSHRGGMPPMEAIVKSRQAARRALEIDDALGEAHGALAHILWDYDWDHRGAEREYQRALELNPNDAVTRLSYALELLRIGRQDDALSQVQRAVELDPLSSDMGEGMARIYLGRREFDRAAEQCRKVVELDPQNFMAQSIMGAALFGMKRYPEGVAVLEKSLAVSGRQAMQLSWLGYMLGVTGRPNHAEQILRELEEQSRRKYVSPHFLAAVYTGLGRKDEAIAKLEQAYQEHSLWLINVVDEFRFDSLRSDPRFKALLNKIGLP